MTKKPTEAVKRHPLNVRTTKEMRERIEAAAAASGRSMVQEVEFRLERSFDLEKVIEDAMGGPQMRQKVTLMIAAFGHNGGMMAHALGHPEWTATEWMREPQCYRAAVFGVFEALLVAQPKAGWEKDEVYLAIESLKGRVASHLANAGLLKFENEDEEKEPTT
ncbi:Arc family DNA-binding protein [Rhizobium sp. SEMIA 4085]|nr:MULTISPECIES: Arc family DNA-binding protein [Rhizobium]NNH32272.1 Arc family DNA-binding protein [Rhizobium sp. SEMIA 4085]